MTARFRFGPMATVLAALTVFAALAGCFRLRAYDLFWHLAAGRYILDQRALPAADPFRFTNDGAPWVDHEWLFQVLVHLVERIGDVGLLAWVRAGVAILLAVLLFAGARRLGSGPSTSTTIAALAVFGARPRLMMRPELASVVALPLLILLVLRYRDRPGLRRAWPAVLLVAVWANLHPGVLIAPAVALALLITKPRSWLLPMVLVVATCCNPVGWRLWAVPLEIGSALSGVAATNPDWTPWWSAPQPVSLLALLFVAGLACWNVVGRRGTDVGLVAVTLLLTALAASGVRHQGLFFTGLSFLAADTVFRLTRAGLLGSSRMRLFAALATCGVLAAWCFWTPPSGPLVPRQGPYRFGLGLEPGRYPVAAAERIAADPGLGHLYHDVAFGGYLIWRFYPERRAFIDGRNEVDPALLPRIAEARNDSRKWAALLAEFDIDGALVRHDERRRAVVAPGGGGTPVYRTTHRLLFPSSLFALVYWDDTGMLLVRRSEARQAQLADEYRVVWPEDRAGLLERAAADPEFRRRALAELERRMLEAPPSSRAVELHDALR